MIINELFTKVVPWEYLRGDSEYIMAAFNIGEDDDEYEYQVSMDSRYSIQIALGGPDETFTSPWEVTFQLTGGWHVSEDGLTNTGNALPVLTTVMDIIIKTVKSKNIQTLTFTADNSEPSRVKLYHRMSKMFEKKGWRYIDAKEVNARSEGEDGIEYDDAEAGRGFSYFILTKQPHPHSQLKGTRT